MLSFVQSRGARWQVLLLLIVLSVTVSQAGSALAADKTFFFLHHSTGRNLMNEGDVRELIEEMSADQDVQLRAWDHDYNSIGLRDADDEYTGYSYNIPDDDTNPEGLHQLWTTANAARDSILARYDVIAFKSCYYPASRITSDEQLAQYKDWYLEIRESLEAYPDKLFIIMGLPPMHRLMTEIEWADRARAFSDWLGSDEFLGESTNIVYYNLFDRFAHPDDGSNDRNMLRYEYERTHDTPNGHPNAYANSIVGPEFAEFVVDAANSNSGHTAAPVVSAVFPLQAYPNPFNPRTVIRFALPAADATTVEIFDLAGHRVRRLHHGVLGAGPHELVWQGRDDHGQALASGTFLCRVTSGQLVNRVSLTLLK